MNRSFAVFRNPIKIIFATLVLFFAIDAVFFRNIYLNILAYNSGGGLARLRVMAAKSEPKKADRELIVLGDSRIAEGFSAKLASELGGKKNWRFHSLAIPSTSLRCWYYFLKISDPDAAKYDDVLIPMQSYSSFGKANDLNDRILDLDYLSPIVPFSEYKELILSFRKNSERIFALRSMLFKGFAFKYDFQDLILRLPKRINFSEEDKSATWIPMYDYEGSMGSLSGISYNSDGSEVLFSQETPEDIRTQIRRTTLGLEHETSQANIDYYDYWLKKLAAHFNKPHQRIVLFEVPMGPLPDLKENELPIHPLLEKLNPEKFLLIEKGYFTDLQKPENFFDGLHMNHLGRRLFTERLASAVLNSDLEDL